MKGEINRQSAWERRTAFTALGLDKQEGLGTDWGIRVT